MITCYATVIMYRDCQNPTHFRMALCGVSSHLNYLLGLLFLEVSLPALRSRNARVISKGAARHTGPELAFLREIKGVGRLVAC